VGYDLTNKLGGVTIRGLKRSLGRKRGRSDRGLANASGGFVLVFFFWVWNKGKRCLNSKT